MKKKLMNILNDVHLDDSNLGGAMTRTQVLETTISKKGWAPWRPLPNVIDFKVEVSMWDELFLKAGIFKRVDGAVFKYQKYRNRDLNRYIRHQIIRLEKARESNPELY